MFDVKKRFEELEKAIEEVSKLMEELGVSDVCKRCAEVFGSCCRDWVEDAVDDILLRINAMLGVKIPNGRIKDGLCKYCGENGCVLKVKPALCETYFCEEFEKLGGKNVRLKKSDRKEVENRRGDQKLFKES